MTLYTEGKTCYTNVIRYVTIITFPPPDVSLTVLLPTLHLTNIFEGWGGDQICM